MRLPRHRPCHRRQNNVVVAGGLDWAYDFSGILDGRQLADPHGRGVIYANHCYDNKGDSVDTWIAKMEEASAKLPVIVSEFGGNSPPQPRGSLGRLAVAPSCRPWTITNGPGRPGIYIPPPGRF